MPHERRKLKSCTNCGFRFAHSADSFCPQCGQENRERVIPITHLVGEFFESVLHLDTKVVKTVTALLVHPGLLTSSYIEGKRVSFVPPLRLYIFISFLFFLLLSSLSQLVDEVTQSSHPSSGAQVHITFLSISADELRGLPEQSADSVMTAQGLESTAFNTYVVRQLIRIANEGYHAFLHLLVKNASYVMFLLMPFFALLLLIFEYQSRPYYVSCLIGSIHFHSFLFIVLSFVLIAIRFSGSSLPLLGGVLIPAAYLYMMLKHLYRQRALATVVKTLGLGVLFLITVIAGTFLTIFVSVMLF